MQLLLDALFHRVLFYTARRGEILTLALNFAGKRRQVPPSRRDAFHTKQILGSFHFARHGRIWTRSVDRSFVRIEGSLAL